MEVRNARYADQGHNRIDCEINHPQYGWIPFTADPDDPEKHGKDIYDAALSSGPAAYTPPDPAVELDKERASMVVSRFQAKAAMLQAGMLPDVEAAISAADATTQLAWAEAVEFRRNSPTITALAQSLGLTDEQVDDLFRQAVTITA